jgi:capsule synthesis protein PGA_cap
VRNVYHAGRTPECALRTTMAFAAALVLLAACDQPAPPSPLPPITRVASVDTATPPPPATPAPSVVEGSTATAAPSATPSQTNTPVVQPLTPVLSTAEDLGTAEGPTATVPPALHFMAVGDLMLARSIGERILSEGPAVPFAGVAPILASADLLVANLECVISDRGEPQSKAYTFRAPPAAADSLALAGVDVVSLANNHSLDYGPEGLRDTGQLLADRQIAAVGAGENEAAARAPAVVERNGLRVAFLAYVDVPVETGTGFDTRTWIATTSSPGIAWADTDHISADVTAARAHADVVVVLLHSGLESRTEVTALQRAEAHAAIDAGAALVVGSHPHVLQGVEQYHGGLIAYSLGNFVFDGFTLPENYSAIFAATLTRDGVGEYNWIPVMVEGGIPRLATPKEAPAILNMLGTAP